jgi:Tol biopolymer transport system component
VSERPSRPRTGAVAVAAIALLGAGVVAGREPHPIRVGYTSQVFLVSPQGGARRVTGPPGGHDEPVWSHSGRRIAMSGDGIEVRAISGSVKHRLGHPGAGTAWSPNDHRLAYVRFREVAADRYVGKLYVSDLDGHERTIVTNGADDALDWSRDGRTIYYLRGGLYQTKPEGIWAVSSGGGKPHRVVADVDPTSRVLVSPDGEHLLFERGGLWIARSGGGGEREIIHANGLYKGYGWLADGRAFGGLRDDDHPVVATVSGRRRRLGVQMRTQRYDLSPDGRRVAWASVRQLSHRVVVMGARPDGSDERVLARFTSKLFPEIDQIRWSPDSRRVAVVPHRHFGD